MNNEKEIELHDGTNQRRRIKIDVRCTTVNIPHLGENGFGQTSFMYSGLKTDDSVEIWTPQKIEMQ